MANQPPRRFPPPGRTDKIPGGYVVPDAKGQALTYLHSRENEAEAMGLEGIVSKRLNTPYRSGPSRDWIKVKNLDKPGDDPSAGSRIVMQWRRHSRQGNSGCHCYRS
jgi:hypothetical protein